MIANLEEAFARVNEHWSPQVIARVNDSHVKVAKVEGRFTWHKHVLIQPVTTRHTGDLVTDRTRSIEHQLAPPPASR